MFAHKKRSERRANSIALSDKVGLSDRLKHLPNELSGGQMQRAAIARALMNNPKILLADEPTGNLDRENAFGIMDLFDAVRTEFGTTIIVVTHDKELAARADREIAMQTGRWCNDFASRCSALAATKFKNEANQADHHCIVAGILFVVLAAASLVANGVFNSIESFSEEGLGKRFILQTSVVDPDMYGGFTTIETDPAKVAQIKAAFEAKKKEKVAAAKRLAITYDPAQEISPITTDPSTGQEGFDRFGELAIKLFGDQSVDLEASALLKSALDDVKVNYQGAGVYQSIPLGQVFSPDGMQFTQTLRVLKDGKESIPPAGGQQQFYGAPDSGLSGVESGLTAFSDAMLTDFLLPEQGFAIDDGTIPIVIPYKASEEILGLTPLKSGTDTNARLDRIKEVRQKIVGKTFQVCMRNQTSIDRQVNNAVQQQNDFVLNKDKKTYVKPELMYDVNDQPCQDVVVSRDARSAATKKYDLNYVQFEKEFGKVDPTQRIVTFKVVGLAPNQPEYAGFSVTDVIKSCFLCTWVLVGMCQSRRLLCCRNMDNACQNRLKQ